MAAAARAVQGGMRMITDEEIEDLLFDLEFEDPEEEEEEWI